MRVCQVQKWDVQRPCCQEGCGKLQGAVRRGLEWGAGPSACRSSPRSSRETNTQAVPTTAGRSESTDQRKLKTLERKLIQEVVDLIRAFKT